MRLLPTTLAATAALILAGCYASTVAPPAKPVASAPPKAAPATTPETPAEKDAKEEATIKEELAKLSADDRKLAEAQKWCVINSEDRLGAMGPPVKVMIKDTPVFLCCDGCEKKAKADPDKTLAKVEELKK